ncbi:MAG TPA: urease accessory UreF family protein [Steroidobacteraceae bacterium]|nr:urease accessory UreF family protein [Steroidobacteraceae bacterium]
MPTAIPVPTTTTTADAAVPEPEARAMLRALRLCHLVSPALPVGAYAYSQGLEFAVHAGWVRDEASTLEWLQGLSHYAIGSLDLPILLRLHRAWSAADLPLVERWTGQLIASRETAELRAEERHLGCSLARVLAQLNVGAALPWQDAADAHAPAFATMFALAAVHWDIAAGEALCGYLWAWSENQVLAAVKLVPLGQSAGQRLLHRLIDAMPKIVGRAVSLDDESIGIGAVSQGLGSALHETQYTRLFRS